MLAQRLARSTLTLERSTRRLWLASTRRFRRFRRTQLGELAGDAFYVSIWQGSTAVADLIMVALIANLLGLAEYGRFALVVAAVTLVGEFIKLRVGYAATAFGAKAMASDQRQAAGVFQLTFLVDLATGVAGLIAMVVLTALGVADLIGVGDGSEDLLIIGALGLVASSGDITCTSILRLLDRFRLVALYSAAIEVGRVVLVVVGLLVFESLAAVLAAVVIGKLARVVTGVFLATRVFHQAAGDSRLTHPSIGVLPRDMRRDMLTMMMHTNFVGYGRLAQVQLPTLLLGGMIGAKETGIYKLGMAAASMLGRLADPASAALMPRFSRLWVDRRLPEMRGLIRQVTLLSVPTMLAMLAILVLLKEPLLRLLGAGTSTSTAATVLVLGATAQALYGAVFWNRTFLFAAERAGAVAATVCGLRLCRSLECSSSCHPRARWALPSRCLRARWSVHFVLTTVAWRTLRAAETQARALPLARA